MARRICSFDWASTPLGPIARWPQSLKTIVDVMLASPSMMSLVWGAEAIHIYNDSFTELLREHDTLALGRSAFETFARSRDVFEADIAAGMAGRSARLVAQRYPVLRHGELQDAWFDVDYAPVRDESGSVAGVLWTLQETTSKVLAERALRESEARLAFLLKLTDALRPLTDPGEIERQATRLLGEQLQADRCFLTLVDDDGERLYVREEHLRSGASSVLGDYTFAQFGDLVGDALHAGRILAVEDVAALPHLAPAERASYAAVAIAAYLLIPLVRAGRLAAYLTINHRTPRAWSDADQSIARQTADRVWAALERARAEAALRASEERQAFLLKFSDALRPIKDPSEVQRIATRMLGEQLGASRVFYVAVESDGDTAEISGDYTDGVPSRAGRYLLSDFSSHGLQEWRAGRTASTDDVETDPRYSEAARRAYASVSTRAGFGVPLVKEGRLVAILGVNQSSPRYWSEQELSLASEVAERTWAAMERARAEAALRESEARFAQFANASAAALWIREADTLAMEFASRAIETIYGIEPEAILGEERKWAALIVPDDREVALEHIRRARSGEVVPHEFRIQRPSDGAFRWIRNTDFPLFDAQGRVQRVGGIAEDVTEAKLAAEHQRVLLAELQHRVRNIMAMVRSMANRTAPGASSVEDYRLLLEGRLLALARVQALLTREANAGGKLKDIIENEIGAQAHHGGQYALTGPDITLLPKAVEVLTLAFHELATNALKYGALSVPEGRISVHWALVEEKGRPWLSLDWIEAGAPAREPLKRRGFGSELIEARIPYELNGRGTITLSPQGARCHLEFPLQGGESILETDAPQPTTVFGGAPRYDRSP